MHKSKDKRFQELDSALNSNNQSSAHLMDAPSSGRSQLDPTKELHQLDAIRKKRDIFNKASHATINQGHKVDLTEDDCFISNQRSESGSSLSQKFIKVRNQNLKGSGNSQVGSSSRILSYSKMGKEDPIAQNSNMYFSPIDKTMHKIDTKLSRYQTIVQQLQDEQKQNEQKRQPSMKVSLVDIKKSKDMKHGLTSNWNKNAFGIIRQVSRFIQQLKTKTERIKFRLLTQKIFDVINDLSANFDYILIQRWIKEKPSLKLKLKYAIYAKAKPILSIFEYIEENISKYIIVIKPDSLFKIVWDIILLFFIIINIFYIPIYISFEIVPNGVFEYLFDLLPSWIFVAEIILNFNTAYYDKGLMHEDRKSIIKHYLKGNFVWDLIVVVPFLMAYLDIPYVRYALLLRITRIQSLMENIEEVLNLEESLQLIVELIKLVFFLIITGHFCGCAWHFVGMQEYETYHITHTWLTNVDQNIMDFEWYDRYILSLYWSVITTVTVGYGDIVPVTTFERIFVIIVTLIICGVFGYCISNIGNIFKTMSDKKTINKTRIRNIRQYMRKRGVSYYLQLKVKKYFEYFFQVEHEDESNTKECLQQLSKHLKEEVLSDLYGKTLRKSRFIRETFGDNTINNLCQHVQEQQVLPEQVLFMRNDQPQRLWIVLQGAIEYIADHQDEDDFYLSTETQLKKMGPGSVIGEREFITQQAYQFNARAVKFTQLIYIDYDAFIKILKENQEDFDRFSLIKDNLIFNPTYKGFGKVCELCKWTHSFIQCPFVFLQPNKNKIADRFTSTKYNSRLKFPYRDSTRSKCLSNLSEIQEGALGYIVLNNIISEKEISDDYLVDLGFELINDETQSNKKNSVMRNQQQHNTNTNNTSDQPQMVPSIQTMEQGRHQTFFLANKEGSRIANNLNSSFEQKDDWDQISQLRKSVKKVNFQTLDRGRTIQSTKSKHGGVDVDESVIQEENKIGSMKWGSSQFIQNKLKMIKSKGHHSNLKKVSFIDNQQFINSNINNTLNSPQRNTYNNSSNQDTYDNKSVKRGQFTKEFSRVSDKSDIQEKPHNNDIVRRMEARESSLLSKKQNLKQEITRRVKKRKTTTQAIINNSLISQIEHHYNSNWDSRSMKKGDKNESSGIFTAAMISQAYLNETEHQFQDNQSIAVVASQQQVLFQNRILDIVHQHQNLDIDIKRSSKVYFPDLNSESVIHKLNLYYEQLMQKRLDEDMKEMRRTKTNMTLFDRIKKAPQKPNQEKSIQEKSIQD